MPADWSDSEVLDFLTKSPWVYYQCDIKARSDAVNFTSPRRGRALFEAGSVVIRWESADLVRHVLARIETKHYNDALSRLSKDYYVIAVVHIQGEITFEELAANLSLFHGGEEQSTVWNRWSREQAEGSRNANQDQIEHPKQSSEEQRRNATAREMLSLSSLSKSGHEVISPALVESGENAEGSVVLFMFPRISALETGGDLAFRTKVSVGMGNATVTVKFNATAMAEGYEGGL